MLSAFRFYKWCIEGFCCKGDSQFLFSRCLDAPPLSEKFLPCLRIGAQEIHILYVVCFSYPDLHYYYVLLYINYFTSYCVILSPLSPWALSHFTFDGLQTGISGTHKAVVDHHNLSFSPPPVNYKKLHREINWVQSNRLSHQPSPRAKPSRANTSEMEIHLFRRCHRPRHMTDAQAARHHVTYVIPQQVFQSSLR